MASERPTTIANGKGRMSAAVDASSPSSEHDDSEALPDKQYSQSQPQSETSGTVIAKRSVEAVSSEEKYTSLEQKFLEQQARIERLESMVENLLVFRSQHLNKDNEEHSYPVRIVFRANENYCLHLWNGMAANGNRVGMWHCAPVLRDAQLWIVKNRRILLRADPNYCLHVMHDKPVGDGCRICLWKVSEKYAKYQTWDFKQGKLTTALDSNLCLHSWKAKAYDGNRTDLLGAQPEYDHAQLWTLEPDYRA